MEKHTSGYGFFEDAYEAFCGELGIRRMSFPDVTSFCLWLMDATQRFFTERNRYAEDLTSAQRKCILDAVSSMRNLSTVFAQTKFEVEFLDEDPGGLARQFGRLCGKLKNGLKRRDDRGESAEMETLAPKKIQTDYVLQSGFWLAFKEFLSMFDAMAAKMVVPIHAEPEKEVRVDNDALLVFQEVLGVLHRNSDRESLREEERQVENYLGSLNATVKWPDAGVMKSDAEFFVSIDAAIHETCDSKPVRRLLDNERR